MGFDDLKKMMEEDLASRQKSNSPYQDSPNDTPQIRQMKQALEARRQKGLDSAKRKKEISDQNNFAQNTENQLRQNAVDNINGKQNLPDSLLGGIEMSGRSQEQVAYDNSVNTLGTAGAKNAEIVANNVDSQWSPTQVYGNFATKFSENFMYGLGNMVGQYGDIAQMLGGFFNLSDLTEGNFISKALQSTATEMKNEHETYIPPELQDPSFSIATLINPDFWAIHGAQFAPQIMEIAGTMGLGAAAERGVVYGLEKGLTKYFAKELAETAAKKGAREAAQALGMEAGEQAVKNIAKDAAEAGIVGTTVNTTARGGQAIEELTQGARGLGRLIRDTGKASNAGQNIGRAANSVTAGAFTNLRVSLANAGEVYNTYAEMKNPDGSEMFSKEELAQMASSTFSNNMNYMAMDILSWGMTYGGGTKILGNAVSGAKKTFTEVAQRKISGGLLSKAIGPAASKYLTSAVEKGAKFGNSTKGLQRWAATGAMEGLEESVQEVHEEWSKMKGFEEAAGSLENYQGKGKDYTDSFWDFYTSKEMEGTRTIASALGFAAGGMFNIKTLINKSADDAHQMNRRSELFKESIKAGTARHELQQNQIEASVSEQVFQGKESYMPSFLDSLVEKEIITEERAGELTNMANEAIANREKTNLLNMNGKRAYYTSLQQENSFNKLKADAEDKLKIRRGELELQFGDLTEEEKASNTDYQKAMADLQTGHDVTMGSLQVELDQVQQNKRNLLTGKPADPIKLASGTYNGNLFYYNAFNPDDNKLDSNPEEDLQERQFEDGDSEVKKMKKKLQDLANTVKEKIPGVVEGAKNLFNKTKELLGKSKSSDENIEVSPEVEQTANEEETVTADYKKNTQDITSMNDDQVSGRVEEILSEIDRLEQEAKNTDDIKTKASNLKATTELNEELNSIEEFVSSQESNQSGTENNDSTVVAEEQESDFKTQSGITMKDIPDDIKKIAEKLVRKENITEVERNKFNDRSNKLNNKDVLDLVENEMKNSSADTEVLTDDDIDEFMSEMESKENGPAPKSPTSNMTDEDDTSDSLLDGDEDIEVKEKRDLKSKKPINKQNRNLKNKKPVKEGVPKINENEQPDTNTTESNKVSQAVSNAMNGGKNLANKVFDYGRSFGDKLFRNVAERKYYDAMIATADQFSHGFVTRQNELNNSGLWNGRERPNVYFVHSINIAGRSFGEGTVGTYVPLANAIFIRQNNFNDEVTFHHEFLHYNYGYMENTDAMKEYLAETKKRNPKLYDQIKRDYNDQTLVSVPRHIAEGKTDAEVAQEVNDIKQLLRESGVAESDLDKSAMDALFADSVKIKKGKLFAAYPSTMGESMYQDMIKKNQLQELPTEEQLYLNEELFVHSQEGARSEKYNMYFEEKPQAPMRPEKKKFWDKMRDRVNRAFPTEQDKTNAITDGLETDNFSQFTDINSAIWSKFNEEFPAGSLGVEVRERRINGIQNLYADENREITNEIKRLNQASISNTVSQTIENQEGIDNDEIQLEEQENLDNQEELEFENENNTNNWEDIDYESISDSFFNDSRNATESALTKVISGVVSYINQRINKRSAQIIAETGEYRSPVLLDYENLEKEMFERAQDSPNAIDFILQMRKSTVPEVKVFMKNLLKGKGQNAEIPLLKSYYNVNKNKMPLSPVVVSINPDGKIQIQDAKTSMMASKSQQIYGDLREKASNNNNSADNVQFLQFVQDMEHIRTTPESEIDDDAIVRVLQFFGDKSIDYNAILEKGYLVVKGNNIPLKKLLKDTSSAMVKGKYTYDSKLKKYMPFIPGTTNFSGRTKYDVYGYRQRVDNIDRRNFGNSNREKVAPSPLNPYYKPLIDAVLGTDSKFKNNQSYRNAEGNLTSARMQANAILNTFKSMSDDILYNLEKNNGYSEVKFINKYANISTGISGQGKFSNALLKHIFKTVSGTKLPYTVSPDFGAQDFGNGVGKILKNQNAQEDTLIQLMYFNDGLRRGNYQMDLGRLSSSSQKYIINVPIQKDLFNPKTGLLNKSNEIVNAFNLYKDKAQNPDLTFEQFSQLLKNDIDNEIVYLNDYRQQVNPKVLENIGMLRYEGKGGIPFTDKQKSDIASYVANNFFNGLYANEIVFPGFKFAKNDLIKRAASGATTYTPLGDNVQNEIIYFHDGSDGDSDTDGAAYILKEDLDRIKNIAGKFMPINGHVKMAHVGVERNGPEGMSGTTQYDKPLYIGIDENYVKQNPKLRPLYELMKARKEKFNSYNNGEASNDYGDGSLNHLVTAVSMSAEKSKNATKKGWAMNLADMDNDVELNAENMDKIYYPKNVFKGFSGKNIGVQIVMNNNVETSIVPSQLISFITTGGDAFGNFARLQEAQQLITESMSDKLSDLEDVVNNGSIQDISDFIKSQKFFNKDKMDQLSAMILFDENMNVATPQARQLVLNTLKQYIMKNGNKLSTSGTQARVTPSFGYEKSFTIDGKTFSISEMGGVGEQNNSDIRTFTDMGSGLQDYRSVYYKDSDGQWKTKYQPAEMVAPANLAKMGVRKRQYFMAWDGNSSKDSNAYRKARSFAKENGVNVSDIRMFKVNGRSNSEASVGFYVPGDVVMGTRIPSHGPQSTGFFEVVDFENTGTSQVQVPPKFTKVTGQDHDGDALFINVKDKDESKWNNAFDILQEHWLSPEMQQNEVNLELNFDEKAKEALAYLEEKIPNTDSEKSVDLMYTPSGRRAQFNNTLISKGNIGSVMSLHRTYSILSNYGVGFSQPIKISENIYDGFNDSYDGNESRLILSANIANMILDDVKEGFASKLGINSNTISYVMPLINMGVDLGEIAVIMNSDVVQQWNQMNEFNDNMFTNSEYLNPDILSKNNITKLLGKENVGKVGNGNINFEDINSTESKAGVIQLISQLSKIQDNASKMNRVIRGHNNIETNSFIAKQDIIDFDNFLNNMTDTKSGQRSNFLVVNDGLKNSPLLANYRKNAQLMSDISEKTDIVVSRMGNRMWDTFVSGNPRNINNEKKLKFHSALEKFTIAQNMGLVGPEVKDYASRIFSDNDNNIFNTLNKYISNAVNPLEPASPNRATIGDSNVLFRHAMVFNLVGNHDQKYIRLNGVIANEETSAEMRELAKQEFTNLPTKLQRDLVLYDLIKTGFAGRNSLYPLFSDAIKADIDNAIVNSLNNKNNISSSKAYSEMAANFAGNNANEYLLNSSDMIKNTGGKITLNNLDKNTAAWNSIKNSLNKGNVVYFTDTAFNNQKSVYVIAPYSNADIQQYNQIKAGSRNELQLAGAEQFLLSKLEGKISQIGFDAANPEVAQVIVSTSPSPRSTIFEDLDIMERRVSGDNYYAYEEKMNRGTFDSVMNYPKNMDEAMKTALYEQYQMDYVKAEQRNAQLSDESLRSMSDQSLQDLYSGNMNSSNMEDKGLGYQNKYAYAKVINRVTMEIANRAAQEQAMLINKNNPNANFKAGENNKDISVISSWLMSSNVPSSNPALQKAIRDIKVQEKIFKGEKAKYMSRLNKVTSELYKEKLGFDPYDGFTGKVKHIYNKATNLLGYGDSMKSLYGNLIKEEIIQDENGKNIKNMRYYDSSEMMQKLKSGDISQAEYNFYNETSKMMEEFAPYVVGDRRRQGYIPHVKPSLMEMYSRKGLLGVMANLRTIDEQLGDVMLSHKGKQMKYGDIVADFVEQYNGVNYNAANSKKQALELYKLKTKATKLLEKGINEDGSAIRYSDIAIGSTLGDTFMNEFSGERGVKASDMPSWDLNKAFADYFHGALFNAGNGNFKGFKANLPLIDGILATASKNNQPNTVKYVDKIWKQYFLQGAKQHHTKTPAHLKAVGVTSDDVVDFLTKGSLFYWLGYKGLAIGNGVYALGNVLAGKYANIKDQGGKSWALGEKRFWKGTEAFDIKAPFKGLKQSIAIMKKAGYMDINIYDDVSLDQNNSFSQFLGDIALMPMTWSEKWIQGVQFLGQLSDNEYSSLANDEKYKLPEQRLTEIESNVTLSQGRGYQPTDQRMVQMYSFGRMAIQFSRWIPTSMYNLFAKEDYDINGNKFIGSYTAFGKLAQRFITGEISPAKYKEYRAGLSPTERNRLDSAFRGFGLMALAAGGASLGFAAGDKMLSDANVFADSERMLSKLTPPAISMVSNLSGM